MFLTIHDVADPHTTSMIPSSPEAQPFQKYSNAARKFDRGVSIQGNSSRNRTFLPRFRPSAFRKDEKASSQDVGTGKCLPNDCERDSANAANCPCISTFASPAWANVRRLPSTLRTRNVLPMRRLPYTATNSGRPEVLASLSVRISSCRPTSASDEWDKSLFMPNRLSLIFL